MAGPFDKMSVLSGFGHGMAGHAQERGALGVQFLSQLHPNGW
jgi:hypothetical protein